MQRVGEKCFDLAREFYSEEELHDVGLIPSA
jgi:hypothetical protein